MNAVMKTWKDGPYIFIVQIGVSPLKESSVKEKRMTSEELPKVMATSDPQEPFITSKPCIIIYDF